VVTVHGVFASLQSSRGHDYCSQWLAQRDTVSLALSQTQAGPKGREEVWRLSRMRRRAHYHDIDREGPSPGNSQVAPPRPGSANRASFASQACVVTHTSERFHASIPTMWAGDIDFVCSNARIWLDDVVNLRCCRQGTAG
jgi:hypothetical protein